MKNRGFTLIELLVVIAIIGLLSSVVLASVNSARNKAKISRAQADLNQFEKAIAFLYDDTGEYPFGIPYLPCSVADGVVAGGANEEVLTSGRIGLVANDGRFSNWKGPYIPNIPLDPWGNPYVYDEDYYCNNNAKGCEGFAPGTIGRGIHSRGPNESGFNVYDSDNIVKMLCLR